MNGKKGPSSSTASVSQQQVAKISFAEHLTHFFHTLISSLKVAFYFFKYAFKPVKPALRLSSEALNAPLPDGLLNEIRQFLTRSGKWQHQPVASLEHFVVAPAPGVIEPRVIGPNTRPVFTSLGFGDMTIRDDMGACGTHSCVVLGQDPNFHSHLDDFFNGFMNNWTPCDGGKNYGDCNGNYGGPCTGMQCDDEGRFQCGDEYSCEGHCGEHSCGEHSENIEFEEYWEHPFVVELRDYFQVSSVENLSVAVQEFIGRNMYDHSAIDTTCPTLEP